MSSWFCSPSLCCCRLFFCSKYCLCLPTISVSVISSTNIRTVKLRSNHTLLVTLDIGEDEVNKVYLLCIDFLDCSCQGRTQHRQPIRPQKNQPSVSTSLPKIPGRYIHGTITLRFTCIQRPTYHRPQCRGTETKQSDPIQTKQQQPKQSCWIAQTNCGWN